MTIAPTLGGQSPLHLTLPQTTHHTLLVLNAIKLLNGFQAQDNLWFLLLLSPLQLIPLFKYQTKKVLIFPFN